MLTPEEFVLAVNAEAAVAEQERREAMERLSEQLTTWANGLRECIAPYRLGEAEDGSIRYGEGHWSFAVYLLPPEDGEVFGQVRLDTTVTKTGEEDRRPGLRAQIVLSDAPDRRPPEEDVVEVILDVQRYILDTHLGADDGLWHPAGIRVGFLSPRVLEGEDELD